MDREINVWKDLRHPNILAFYGACSFASPPFMVCEYKANGSVVEYLRRFPDENRCQLVRFMSLSPQSYAWKISTSYCSYATHLLASYICIKTRSSMEISKE